MNKQLTRFNIVENLNAVVAGAKKMGVNLVNIGVVDLEEGKPHLILGLVWQILKARSVKLISSHPYGIIRLRLLQVWLTPRVRPKMLPKRKRTPSKPSSIGSMRP